MLNSWSHLNFKQCFKSWPCIRLKNNDDDDADGDYSGVDQSKILQVVALSESTKAEV